MSHFLQETFINNWVKGKKDQTQKGSNNNFNVMTCMCVIRTVISCFEDDDDVVVVAQWD